MLQFLHLTSCNSMDVENMDSIARMFEQRNGTQAPNRLKVVTGFHGAGAIWVDLIDEYERLAKQGASEGVIAAWQSLLHQNIKYSDGYAYQCPVSYGRCRATESYDQCARRLWRTTYFDSDAAAGESGEATWGVTFGHPGCNPPLAEPFEYLE